jgi:c-di-GMP-binding flagellar brake protein YcgR
MSFLPGDTSTVFNASNAEDAPQPPKVLTTPLEIASNLRALEKAHDPLIITFTERSQRFQTFLVDVNHKDSTMALDEMIPRDGEKYLLAGEPFRVEGFHDGIRIAWDCHGLMTVVDNQENGRSYRGDMPKEVLYHQRRNAFRAALKLTALVDVELAGDKLNKLLKGKLLDISATGCKLRFDGDHSEVLQLGQIYERYTAHLPFGKLTTAVELRHLHYEESLGITFAGVRFHNINAQTLRNVENFVFQLQREARRFDKDDY